MAGAASQAGDADSSFYILHLCILSYAIRVKELGFIYLLKYPA